jgi:hypothetical protein
VLLQGTFGGFDSRIFHMMMVQVQLVSNKAVRTCWVEDKVKVGNEITLKNSDEPDRRWKVTSVSLPRERNEIRSDWKVGGL